MNQNLMVRFIAELRKEAGITQKQLAEKLHVSDKTISHWERGESSPDLSLIPVIADIFGITCDELLHGKRENDSEIKCKKIPENEENSSTYNIEKNLNKLKVKMNAYILASLTGLFCGITMALLFDNLMIGFLLVLAFMIPSVFGIFISYNTFRFSVKNNYKISDDMKKSYFGKGFDFLFVYYMVFSVLLSFAAAIAVCKSGMMYSLFTAVVLADISIVIATVAGIVIKASGKYYPFKSKEIKKKAVVTGTVISFALLIIAVGTAVFQNNCYNGNIGVDIMTMRFTDVYEFKDFMEKDEKIRFNSHNSELCLITDENDELVQFEWKNEIAVDYDVYNEENEEFCIFVNILPDGSKVNWNEVVSFAFQFGYFLYPFVVVVSFLSFEICFKKIKKKNIRETETGQT